MEQEKEQSRKKVLVAMSGGVDSSAAAMLLREAGYDCVGITMRLREEKDDALDSLSGAAKSCCSLDDAEDARMAAFRLGMPFHVLNLSGDFRRCVVEPFVEAYRSCRTPNPCIACNRYLKFDRLFEKAKLLSCGAVATGHYARITRDGDRFQLRKGLDPGKDQSYVLYMLGQEELSRTLFPLGELRKEEVRELAEKAGLRNARKPDSQDICFVPDGDYASFIERETGESSPPGDFVDEEGKVIGRHQGLIRYTVGQRRGLGVAAAERLYVKELNPKNNTITLAPEEGILVSRVELEDFCFSSVDSLPEGATVEARLRYHQKEAPARFWKTENGALLEFLRPIRKPAPGQAGVLYDGDLVLGGGTIGGERA